MQQPETRRSVVGRVPLANLAIDPRVQRTVLNVTRLNKMIANFDPNALGTLVVSKRNANSFIVLDGMHRVETCKSVRDAPTELDALIFEDLTLAEEATLFRLYNERTAVGAVDRFRAAVIEGEPIAVEINRILARFGMEASTSSFQAVATARRIAERDRGLEILAQALKIMDEAWGLRTDTADGRILEGIAELLYHVVDFDSPGFVKRLAKHRIDDLITKIRGLQETMRNKRLVSSTVTILRPIYNSGRRQENWLPEFMGGRRLKKAAITATPEIDDSDLGDENEAPLVDRRPINVKVNELFQSPTTP